MTTLKTLTSLCLAASAIQTACALDLERWCMGRGVCLTSFRWCVGTDGECEFPENVYRRYVGNNVGFAGLAWNEEYEVTWKDADKDYPVNVEWSVPTENGEESIRWDKNVTKGEESLTIKFKDLIDEMDTSRPELYGRALSLSNHITISQPEAPEDHPERPPTMSDPFALFDSETLGFFETQKKFGSSEEYDKWKLGVGIGVGVGVPILMAASGAVGWVVGRRKGPAPGKTFQN